MSLFGLRAPIEGTARGDRFEVTRLGDAATGDAFGRITGQLDGGVLVLTVASTGDAPQVIRLQRDAASAPRRPAGTEAPRAAPNAPTTTGGAAGGASSAYAGTWEATSDDGTHREVVRLAVEGDRVGGTLDTYERGYFSGRVTQTSALRISGIVRDGRLDLRLADGGGTSIPALARRRGAFLLLRIQGREFGYARDGAPLVASADGSSEAQALARAITGRVFQTSSQAGRRDGAIVGARMRLALCANGSIEYDVSDVGSVGGHSLGSTESRRGQWRIVLYAGVPTVQARWRGTGTSYSLTRYFDVRPATDAAADVDGVRVPLAGSC
jgi:hypothetical protein